MYDWETRLTSVDNNRVVRPLEWGVEWARDWPCRNGVAPGQTPEDPEKFFTEPHYEGFPAVLVRLVAIDEIERELLIDGWRCQAPPALVRESDL